jgi:hypothetical protein
LDLSDWKMAVTGKNGRQPLRRHVVNGDNDRNHKRVPAQWWACERLTS